MPQVGQAGLTTGTAQGKYNIGDNRKLEGEAAVHIDAQKGPRMVDNMAGGCARKMLKCTLESCYRPLRRPWHRPVALQECHIGADAYCQWIPVYFPSLLSCACNLVPVLVIWFAWVMGLVFQFCIALSQTPYGKFGDRFGKQIPAKRVSKCKCSILRLPHSHEGPVFVWTGGCHFGGPLSPAPQENLYGVPNRPVCISSLIPRHGRRLNMVAQGGFEPSLAGFAQFRSENAYFDDFCNVSTARAEVLGDYPLGLGFGGSWGPPPL